MYIKEKNILLKYYNKSKKVIHQQNFEAMITDLRTLYSDNFSKKLIESMNINVDINFTGEEGTI